MGTAVIVKPEEKKRPRLKTMLAAAVGHPVRTLCFAILGERHASAVELARDLRLDKAITSYHLRQLAEWNLVEEVDRRRVRGATERFYQAIELPELKAEEEEALSPAERRRFAETILSLFAADAARSLEEELLCKRTDHILTRFAFHVDQEGWDELVEAYHECFERVRVIEANAAKRLEDDGKNRGKAPLRVMSFLGLFELPPLRRI
jgi:DNA-binding transcriptional ArsR family regulator